MDAITNIFDIPFSWLMEKCYSVLHGYVFAIILFTVLTKILLLPVSMWTQKNGITMVKMMPEINRLKIKYFGDKATIAEEQQKLNKKYHYHPLASSVPLIIQVILLIGVMGAVKTLLGTSDSVLTKLPIETGGVTLLMPLGAGLAALCLTLAQNKIGPLQREQSKAEQWSTGVISVGISLFLGAFVSLGTGVYWICSNLFSIPLQLLLNVLVNPKKYVDYKALEESKKELACMNSLSSKVSKEDKKREKEDYKKFFHVVNKHLVFYSESSGFYKYFKGIIEYLLEHSNITIHYVTGDPKDQIFEIAKSQPKLRPYYIGEKKLITLFMKMDADMVVMSTPDLENYYLKRSYVRKDIEYAYFAHGMSSTNLTTQKGAYDHFDTILCAGKHQIAEIRETEEKHHLKPKTLVPYGYGLLDNMLAAYEKMPKVASERRSILIAPSWQKDNILESCIEELVHQLYSEKNYIVVRPHPEFIKRYPQKIEKLKTAFADLKPELFQFELDFSSNVTVYTADLLITDWSSIAQEYCFTTGKPVLLVNTPMKVLNLEYAEYKNAPTDIVWRNIIGETVELNEIDRSGAKVEELFSNQETYRQRIMQLRDDNIFNIGHSAEEGAKYIINALQEKISMKKKQ